MKLLDLIDTNMELFDKDPGFWRIFTWMVRPSCWTTILEMRPEKREGVKMRQRRTFPDWSVATSCRMSFLTSGEANVRNIQTGIREAKAVTGNLTKVGLFPRMRSAMRDRCLSC